MRKSKGFAVLILFFLMIFILLFPAPFAWSKNISVGQKLYEDRCLRCHGYNGQGSLEAAKSLKVDAVRLNLTRDSVIRKSRRNLERLIAEGHGKMPSQENLSAKQIQLVVKYLQTLQKAYVSRESFSAD